MIEMLKDLAMPGMPDPVAEILGIFEADAVVVVKRLTEAAAAGDLAEVKAAAHRLKGAGGNLGATELCAVLSRIEQAAKAGSLDSVQDEIQRSPALVDATIQALHALS